MAKKRKKAKRKSASRSSSSSGLNPTQFAVMQAMHNNNGSITAAQLATTLHINGSAAGKRVQFLKEAGFIKGNGTRGSYSFTAKGSRAFNTRTRNPGSRTPASSSANSPSVTFTSRSGVGTITIKGITQSQINQIVAAHFQEGVESFFAQVVNQGQ